MFKKNKACPEKNRELCSMVRRGGFTLIEMMVVITILGIVMTMLVLTFKNNSTRDLEITSQQVKTALEEAMSLSLGPNQSDIPALPNQLNGYGVHFERTGSTDWTYLIYADKVGNEDYQGGDKIIKPAIDFKKNIEVSKIQNSIQFAAGTSTSPSSFFVFFGIPKNTDDVSVDDPAIPYDRTFLFNGQNYLSGGIEYGVITFGTNPSSSTRQVKIDVITGSITVL